jgi:hypothetical protein
MRILSISLLVFASSASAQSPPSVDCNAVKNSMVPVELAYHSQNGTRTVVQAYRDKSGDYVVWSRQTPPSTHPNPPVFVTKATYVDGAIASAELSTTYAGKYSHRTAKYTPDGLPKNFDRRSDVTYKMHAVTTPGDDTTEEKTSTISYKFKSEETTAVGSCVSLLKPRRGYLSAQPKRRPRAGNRACGIGRLDADGVSVWYAFRTQVGHSGTSEKYHERKSGLLRMGRATDHQLSDKRQLDPECRTAVIPIFCPYQPVVRFDNGARDGLSHAHAFGLGGEKRFEHAF